MTKTATTKVSPKPHYPSNITRVCPPPRDRRLIPKPRPMIKHIIIMAAFALTAPQLANGETYKTHAAPHKTHAESHATHTAAPADTLQSESQIPERQTRLTEEDYREVAEALDVEVAAIKAVVDIEAGRTHQGFWAQDKPVINFDLAMFRRMAARNKVSLTKATKTHPVIFSRPNVARYGSQQAAQQARLDAAREIHDLSAIQGTFWGMFQIGGFNWKKCGAESPEQFVELMSRSERDQLDLFANFVRNTGMQPFLKAKNWAAFAKRYNGNSYAARGYHTRLAQAYAKHKQKEKSNGES